MLDQTGFGLILRVAGPYGRTRPVSTIAQARSRLSEILYLAEEEGLQHIGKRRSFVVVSVGD